MRKDDCSKELISILHDAKDRGDLVELYTGFLFEDDFDVGILVALNSANYMLRRISPLGLDDGVLVGRCADILRICCESKYLHSIQLLQIHRDKLLLGRLVIADRVGQVVSPGDDADLFRFELEQAIKLGDVVKVWATDMDHGLSCTILECEEDTLVAKEVGEFGEFLGLSRMRIADVTRFRRASIADRKLRILMDNQ